MKKNESLLPMERIDRCILVIRRQKVMLDEDLAGLYGVEVKRLIEAVKRNIDRFPEDFMFRLTDQEVAALRIQFGSVKSHLAEDIADSPDRRFSKKTDEIQEDANLKSQIATSSLHPSETTEIFSPGIVRLAGEHGGRRKLPHVFTEQGVAMLSSVLNSPRAVRVNIEIMRAFVRLRVLIGSHAELARKVEELEKKCDAQFGWVFEAIRRLMVPPTPPEVKKRKIGFGRSNS